jgi:hypothetical protein
VPDQRIVRLGNYTVLIDNRNLVTPMPDVAFCGANWAWVAKSPATTDLHCRDHGLRTVRRLAARVHDKPPHRPAPADAH